MGRYCVCWLRILVFDDTNIRFWLVFPFVNICSLLCVCHEYWCLTIPTLRPFYCFPSSPFTLKWSLLCWLRILVFDHTNTLFCLLFSVLTFALICSRILMEVLCVGNESWCSTLFSVYCFPSSTFALKWSLLCVVTNLGVRPYQFSVLSSAFLR